jgi:putative ABC transport system permease protein
MNNFRFAIRQLRKSPGFTCIAVLTLALGIGANTAIFSVIYAVLLRPLPYPEGDRIVLLAETDKNQPSISVSLPDYLDWERDATSFEQLAVGRRDTFNLSGLQGRAPEQITGAMVTANFFKVIGLAPQIGRVFTEEEDRVGGPQLVVISDRLWERLFQRDAKVLGRTLMFANEACTVIGVMPTEMFSPRASDVWFPLIRRSDNPTWQSRDNHPGLIGWARLKKGKSLEQAQREMSNIAARLAKTYPESNANVGVKITKFLDNQIGEYRTNLNLLLAAVGFVLLIACANLANLLAARGAARAREFALRAAVGATRWQIVRQLLIESIVLAILGGALGLCFAAWGRDLLVALAPRGVARFEDITLNRWVLVFSALLTLLTSLLFGLWPAWQNSHVDVQLALKSGGHGSSEALRARRSRDLLIIIEVALTLVLLSAAGLVFKSFANARALHLGFEPRHLLTARIDLPQTTYGDNSKVVRFSKTLLDRLQTLPGLEKVALACNPPLLTGWQTSFLPDGMAEPKPGEFPSAEMTVTMGDYFGTLKVPLLRGRAFNERDTADAPLVIIIDQAAAERYFPGQDPIGKRIRMHNGEGGRQSFHTIVGIVPRLKVYGYDEGTAQLPQMYLPQAQSANNNIVVLVRGSISQQSFETSVREIAASLDPAQPAHEFQSMQERVEETWATPRLMSFLLTAFAILALLLAVVGLYGVMAYNGVRRTREIGVRLALGARRRQISAMMLSQGMRLLIIGLAIGFAAAFLLARLMRSLLFGVSAGDPLTYLGVSIILSLAAAVACWIPAHRASRVDPIIILRTE